MEEESLERKGGGRNESSIDKEVNSTRQDGTHSGKMSVLEEEQRTQPDRSNGSHLRKESLLFTVKRKS